MKNEGIEHWLLHVYECSSFLTGLALSFGSGSCMGVWEYGNMEWPTSAPQDFRARISVRSEPIERHSHCSPHKFFRCLLQDPSKGEVQNWLTQNSRRYFEDVSKLNKYQCKAVMKVVCSLSESNPKAPTPISSPPRHPII